MGQEVVRVRRQNAGKPTSRVLLKVNLRIPGSQKVQNSDSHSKGLWNSIYSFRRKGVGMGGNETRVGGDAMHRKTRRHMFVRGDASSPRRRNYEVKRAMFSTKQAPSAPRVPQSEAFLESLRNCATTAALAAGEVMLANERRVLQSSDEDLRSVLAEVWSCCGLAVNNTCSSLVG